MSGEITELTADHWELLKAIENGADIIGHYEAGLLRDIERLEPDCITITKVMGDYDPVCQLPYFGAIATNEGIERATQALNRTEAE